MPEVGQPDRRRHERLRRVLAAVIEWAEARRDVRGLALVGSQACGRAKPDSDIDLVLLVEDPPFFRGDTSWVAEIDWSRGGASIRSQRDAEYGLAWSRHIRLDDGLEVEFTFAAPSWAGIAPVDPGTRHVVMNGCRILHDPDGLLSKLWTIVQDENAG